jgi:serine phosphatase RsbU (regulator of sigma subunit)/anti-sigma regulatory factor (Ser/Thr protein kinase)
MPAELAPTMVPRATATAAPGASAVHDAHRNANRDLDRNPSMDAGARLRFLNRATQRIGPAAGVPDVVRGLCEVTVPGFAQYAGVWLRAKLLGGMHVRSEQLRWVVHVWGGRADDWCGLDPTKLLVSPQGSAPRDALEHGRPTLLSRIDLDTARELICALGLQWGAERIHNASALLLPLPGRGQTLGFTVLIRLAGNPGYDQNDLLMASQLAAQAGYAIDATLRYEQEAHTADTLQRSMLPTHLPTVPGIQIAHRYLPASRTAQVGGDWYDVIPLPGNRVAMVVGDVMGHGARSAAIMGQLRTAVQTLAALDLPPHEVLHNLDELARRLGENHVATCVYAVYDPVSRRCVIANAGHIPPVMVRAAGYAELLRLPTGVPIGVGGVPFESVDIAANDGDLIVLCTDGLIESRGQDIRLGLAELCGTLTAPPYGLDELCDTLLQAIDTDSREDDVALLAARFDGIPVNNVAHWLLKPNALTPRRVRELVARTLHGWRLEDQLDVAELLASELATNAVRYADRLVTLRLSRTDVLLCEVGDDDHRLPVLCRAAEDDEHGRGLYLVSRLAARWGTTRLARGKVVWFEIPVS